MADERKVLGRRGQLLVAIPARARRALGLAAQQSIWFHYPRTGEILLAIREERAGGRPALDLPCPHCDRRERELVELRAKLAAKQTGSGRQYFTQGYEQAVRHYGNLADRLDVALALLRELTGRRARRRGGPGLQPHRRSARTDAVPGPDTYPRPDSSPSEVRVEEGAATSGAQLPGGPLEH